MSAAGGIVAPAGTNSLGATLAGSARVGSGTRIATAIGAGAAARVACAAARAACAGVRSATGRASSRTSACSSAGTRARSSSTRSTCAARLRVGETDRPTGKQRAHGHRENCLAHFFNSV